jgi:hypothetical protein
MNYTKYTLKESIELLIIFLFMFLTITLLSKNIIPLLPLFIVGIFGFTLFIIKNSFRSRKYDYRIYYNLIFIICLIQGLIFIYMYVFNVIYPDFLSYLIFYVSCLFYLVLVVTYTHNYFHRLDIRLT